MQYETRSLEPCVQKLLDTSWINSWSLGGLVNRTNLYNIASCAHDLAHAHAACTDTPHKRTRAHTNTPHTTHTHTHTHTHNTLVHTHTPRVRTHTHTTHTIVYRVYTQNRHTERQTNGRTNRQTDFGRRIEFLKKLR